MKERQSAPLFGEMRAQILLGSAKEDYVLPEAHTVTIGLSPEDVVDRRLRVELAGAPRPAQAENRKLACKDRLTIARVPFSLDRALSGVRYRSSCPTGARSPTPT